MVETHFMVLFSYSLQIQQRTDFFMANRKNSDNLSSNKIKIYILETLKNGDSFLTVEDSRICFTLG